MISAACSIRFRASFKRAGPNPLPCSRLSMASRAGRVTGIGPAAPFSPHDKMLPADGRRLEAPRLADALAYASQAIHRLVRVDKPHVVRGTDAAPVCHWSGSKLASCEQ